MGDNCIGIYRIRNIVDGKVYIGHSRNVPDRWRRHRSKLRHGSHENSYLQAAYNKHGELNFVYEVVLECAEADLVLHEMEAIASCKSNNPVFGYNLSDGGEGWGLLTQAARDKISEKLRGLPKTEEHKRKLGDSLRGRALPDEVKEKLRVANTGKQHSEATRAKLSEAQKGHTTSEETKAKIGLVHKGNQYCKGMAHGPEVRANMSAARRKAKPSEGSKNGRAKVTEETVIALFTSLAHMSNAEASRHLGLSETQIGRIRGRKQWGHVVIPT